MYIPATFEEVAICYIIVYHATYCYLMLLYIIFQHLYNRYYYSVILLVIGDSRSVVMMPFVPHYYQY